MTIKDFAELVARFRDAEMSALWSKRREDWDRVRELGRQVDLGIRAVREGRDQQFNAYGRG